MSKNTTTQGGSSAAQTKKGQTEGNGWAWIPVVAAIVLAMVVPSVPIEDGSGKAYGQASRGLAVVPPTGTVTETPTNTPTSTPTDTPTNTPTETPTNTPTNTPAETPTNTPTNTPTATPTNTPTQTPTNTPTNTPTTSPTNTPVPPSPTATTTPVATPAVGLNVGSAIPGQPLVASGTVPDTALTYTLCVVPNGSWTIGSAFAGSCLLQQAFTTPTNAFSGVALGPAPAPGGYDLLLLRPGGTIEAAQDASAAAGLVVAGASEIPVGSRAGLFGFALLVAAGAWVLLRQFR